MNLSTIQDRQEILVKIERIILQIKNLNISKHLLPNEDASFPKSSPDNIKNHFDLQLKVSSYEKEYKDLLQQLTLITKYDETAITKEKIEKETSNYEKTAESIKLKFQDFLESKKEDIQKDRENYEKQNLIKSPQKIKFKKLKSDLFDLEEKLKKLDLTKANCKLQFEESHKKLSKMKGENEAKLKIKAESFKSEIHINIFLLIILIVLIFYFYNN